jgi:hypothetical protein
MALCRECTKHYWTAGRWRPCFALPASISSTLAALPLCAESGLLIGPDRGAGMRKLLRYDRFARRTRLIPASAMPRICPPADFAVGVALDTHGALDGEHKAPLRFSGSPVVLVSISSAW